MKRMIGLLMMMGLVVGVVGCGEPDNYRLFIYPDRHDLTVHREFGPYDSVEKARNEANSEMSRYSNGDYEIGKNCEKKSYTTLWICEDTFR